MTQNIEPKLRSARASSSLFAWLVSVLLAIILLFLTGPARGAETQPIKITPLGEWPGYQRTTSADTSGHATSLVMSGSYGYSFAYPYGPFLIFDFRNPQKPNYLGVFQSEGRDLAVGDGYLYETGRFGFRVLDISNPAIPLVVGSVTTATSGIGVAHSGRYAYVTAGTSGLYVIDTNNPQNPMVVGRLETNGGGRRVVVSGNFAYVMALSGPALEIINVTDPTKPLLAKAISLSDTPRDITIDGTYAYVVGSSLEIFELSDPANPIAQGEISLPLAAADIQVRDGRAYVAVQEAGLHVFDVRDKANPVPLGRYDTDGRALGVWLQSDLVYIAADTSGVQVVDFRDPANPRLVGSYETSGYTQGIAVSKGHAFLAESFPAMRSINITDPQQPMLADTLDTQSRVLFASDIAIAGDYAYLLGNNNSGGVGIGDPGNLTPAGIAGTGTTVVRSGNYLYFPWASSACSSEHPCGPRIYEGGFTIYEILRFPGRPQFEGQYLLSEREPQDVRAWDLAVAESYAYVAHTVRLGVVDVSDPKVPVAVSELPLDCWRIAVSGDYAYVAGLAPTRPLSVIDVQDKSAPTQVAQATTQRLVNSMVVSGKHLYVSSSNLVEVFDLSDPEKPVSVGSVATKGEGLDLAVEGNLIYVADGSWGLQIFRVEPPFQLEADLAGTELRLRWPTDATNYILQSTLTLTDPQWEPVGAAPQVQDGFNVVKLPASSPAAFFQLLRP